MLDAFTKHPKSVCMSYEQHMRLSLRFASIFAGASLKAVAHAFFPCCFITSTSDAAQTVTDILESSGCRYGNDESGHPAPSSGDGATSDVDADESISAST